MKVRRSQKFGQLNSLPAIITVAGVMVVVLFSGLAGVNAGQSDSFSEAYEVLVIGSCGIFWLFAAVSRIITGSRSGEIIPVRCVSALGGGILAPP